jgi:hypothetical protein
MGALYVPLPEDVKRALLDLSEREDRHPKMQAARLIRERLAQLGLLASTTGADVEEDRGPA